MWEFLPPRVRLTGIPHPGEVSARRIAQDFARFRDGLPRPLEAYVLEAYGIDLGSEYAGLPLKNPFGKASGQLSLSRHQVERDAEGGLGFVILKTVIAQDSSGEQSMREWAIPETRMLVEPIRGRLGREGWTVTWKGRGWFDTFDAYRDLFDWGLRVGQAANMLVAPSVKYHLPGVQDTSWKLEEYSYTTCRLLEIWSEHYPGLPMPLEKDFSPTLAGSERATQQARISDWLEVVPSLIHSAAPGRVRVGLKMLNALFEDEFQLRMLDTVHSAQPGEGRADFLVYANRLFDPARKFEDKLGVAYGGPDLSDRNLAVLERFLSARPLPAGSPAQTMVREAGLPLSATGDIHSGRMAVEYLLRGASSFQMHTLFQLSNKAFSMRNGNKTEKCLHHLLFDPENGALAWLLDLQNRFAWKPGMNICQRARWCQENWAAVAGQLSPPENQALG